jgi:hypothetical protein
MLGFVRGELSCHRMRQRGHAEVRPVTEVDTRYRDIAAALVRFTCGTVGATGNGIDWGGQTSMRQHNITPHIPRGVKLAVFRWPPIDFYDLEPHRYST